MMTTSNEARTALTDLSDALAAAVERAGASTVTVNARRRIPASGVVWAPGVVVTADHVIEREDDITVAGADGNEIKATLAGRDPGSDIAVLRVEGGSLTVAEQGPGPGVGSIVLAVGRPGADGPMASMGVVSAVGGPWRTGRGSQVDGYLRADVTLYPGFSGGPLVDASGRVAGITSSRLGRGAGLTIPAAAVQKVVDQLLTGGRVKRAYLGIGSQQVRLPAPLAQAAGGQETGLLIVSVEQGSAAEQGGLLIGDILVAFAGSPVKDTDGLQGVLTAERVGQASPVDVLRGGERRTITVTVGERA